MINTSITLGYTSTLDPKTHNPIQKTLEPCEDCISRQAVLNQIFYSTDNSGDVVLGSTLRRRIENLPPVTPERPKGEWRKTALGTQCSNCLGFALFRVSASGEEEIKSAFCPYCGADMREVSK